MTVIVGGVYREQCRDPAFNRLYGSGARAARVLGNEVTCLVTVADESTMSEIAYVLDSVHIEAAPRRSPIGFSYSTPLSLPSLSQDPFDNDIGIADVDAEDVIVFGMVEARPKVVANRAVVDPQHSLSLEAINETVTADEILVVANCREVCQLATTKELEQAVDTVLESTGARGVIVKAGALGALVFERDREPCGVPALTTPSVMPIGSGDVFTAALARQYFVGDNLVTAAYAASKRTAVYAATHQLGHVDAPPEWRYTAVPTPNSVRQRPYVYVAASFATPEQRWSASTVTNGIEDIGGKCIYPLRDIGPVIDARITAEQDLDELDRCEAVLILADVARSGPFFEGGWAAARGIPVVVVSSDRDRDRYTMLRGTGATVVSDLATGAYRSIWDALAHRHTLTDRARLMLLSGGLDSAAVAAIERPEGALFVDYGQRAGGAERESARRVARILDIQLDEITVDASEAGSGLLVDGEQVDVSPSPEWFPFRNQLLVTVAAAYAIRTGYQSVLLGTVEDDGRRHADGTHRFIASLDAVLRSQEGGLRLAAPHADTSTTQLLATTELRDQIVAVTHSCDVATTPCGDCNSCQRRAAILETFSNET